MKLTAENTSLIGLDSQWMLLPTNISADLKYEGCPRLKGARRNEGREEEREMGEKFRWWGSESGEITAP